MILRLACGTLVVALLTAATSAAAGPRLPDGPSVSVATSGDRVIIRWSDLPADAVEQEILMSIDGGRHWAEIARPETIDVRRIELGLPRGVDMVIRFALRAGSELAELGEAESEPVSLRTRPDPGASLGIAAGWRPGERREADPGQGGLPAPAVEPDPEETQRSPKSSRSDHDGRSNVPPVRSGRRGPLSIPAVSPASSPLEFPLRN